MLGTENVQAELLDTKALCAKLLRPGSVYEFLAEHRRELFPDEDFAGLFPSERGRPSIPASRIASVMVLQALEGLSDREAAEEVRLNLAWKMALGLALDDEGFHPSVLTWWRRRFRESSRPKIIFEITAKVIEATGIKGASKKRSLDSTVLADSVATQDTFTQLTAQTKRVARLVPSLSHLASPPSHKRPEIDYRDPEAVEEALSALVNQATVLVEAAAGMELTDEAQDAIGLLALLSGQDVEPVDEQAGRFRIARKVARDRVVSVVDPEARHVHKSRANHIEGYKGHIAVDPKSEVVTGISLTKGGTSDAEVAAELIQGEEGLEIYADSGYSSAKLRAELAEAGHEAIIKPHPLSMAVPGGFTLDDFRLDDNQLTCPAGKVATIGAKGRASFTRHCSACPLKKRCTRSKRGRVVKLDQAALINRDARAGFDELRESYNTHRPVVERVHAQMKRKLSGSKLRYRGLDANSMHYSLLAAVWNLKVLIRNGLSREAGAWALSG
ncbi:MAG: IS1182 family transposase [Actinomycetota bacterium]|nr:IS1182 family transposase [Actinomycetota bacterium]